MISSQSSTHRPRARSAPARLQTVRRLKPAPAPARIQPGHSLNVAPTDPSLALQPPQGIRHLQLQNLRRDIEHLTLILAVYTHSWSPTLLADAVKVAAELRQCMDLAQQAMDASPPLNAMVASRIRMTLEDARWVLDKLATCRRC